jgi:hypothetical protein
MLRSKRYFIQIRKKLRSSPRIVLSQRRVLLKSVQRRMSNRIDERKSVQPPFSCSFGRIPTVCKCYRLRNTFQIGIIVATALRVHFYLTQNESRGDVAT